VATSASVAEAEEGTDDLVAAAYCNVDERPTGFGSSRSGPGVLERGKDAATPENEKLCESELTGCDGRWTRLVLL
jgi:hypothetical protein